MNRTMIIVVAVVVAVASGAGMLMYVGRADARATKGVELVPVLVAKGDLPAGMPFTTAWERKQIVPSETLRRLMPPTAVTSTQGLQGKVAVNAVANGQVIVSGMFTDATKGKPKDGAPTFADRIPEGQVAVTFKGTADTAVADLVQPGDRVNFHVQVPNAAEIGLPDSGGPAIVTAFQNLRVVAIGKVTLDQTAPTAPENPGTGLYTVLVDAQDATRVLFLSRQYPVLLTLLPPNAKAGDVPPVGKKEAVPPNPAPEQPAPAAPLVPSVATAAAK
jgi:pilus assembly protein CpaB